MGISFYCAIVEPVPLVVQCFKIACLPLNFEQRTQDTNEEVSVRCEVKGTAFLAGNFGVWLNIRGTFIETHVRMLVDSSY